MAKRRKASGKGKAQGSGWRMPVLLLALMLGAAFIVLSGPAAIRDRLWKALGPTIVLTIPALAVVLWVAWQRPGHFLRHWNRWLAGVILALDGLLFLSLFHLPNRSYTAAGLAGDVGRSVREFLGPGSLASWTISNIRVDFPSWGSFWGLILLAAVAAFLFSPRTMSQATAHAGARLATLGDGLIRLIGRIGPIGLRVRAPQAPRSPRPPEPSPPAPAQASLAKLPLPPMAQPWQLPSLELLAPPPGVVLDQPGAQEMAARLEQVLASYGIEAKVVEVNPGPAVTQFGLEPGWVRQFREVKENKGGETTTRKEEVSRTRVKVDAIAALDKDLAVALAAPALRIEAPVPGKSFVGVEVPNAKPVSVGLRSAMDTPAFLEARGRSKLPLALGLGVGGQAGVADMTRLPHLLIAGATGSGKSVCLKAFLTCLALTTTPEQARLVLVDPKRVEFTRWRDLPHLLYPPVVEPGDVVLVFQELIAEMEQRYQLMAQFQVSDLEGYNRVCKVPVPYLVVLVDELADLMMTAPEEVEKGLTRLAQLGRSAGIHLVVATQRPSVDVVTGLIKANFPARISFNVASQTDSRVILDMVGAEKLLGRGDMLFLPPDAPQPRRFQGCFVTEAEMDRVVGWWVAQTRPPAPAGLAATPGASQGPEGGLGPAAKAVP